MRRTILALPLCALLLLGSLAGGLLPVGSVAASTDLPKAKVLYFQNATALINGNTSYLMDTTLPTALEVVEEFTDAGRTFRWFLDPPLAGDLVLNGTVRAFLWVRFLNAKGAGTTSMTLGLGLYAHEGGSVTTILNEGDAANRKTHSFVTSHFSEYDAEGTLSGAVTVPAGARLEIVLRLDSNATVIKRIAWGSDDFRSRAALPAGTRIGVDSIRALNATGGAPPFFQPDDNITFNATITDPFGGYDIVWVNLTLEGPNGTLFEGAPMVQTSGNDTAFAKTFELNWPDVPKGRGSYNVTVEAVDNTGFHFRFPDRPGDVTFGGHLESLTVLLSVGEIIWANFVLEDAQHRPLEEALLELWDGTVLAASGTANGTGAVNLTGVPGTGNYAARGFWQDVQVLDQVVNLPGPVNEDAAIVLTLGVYDPTFQVLDDARVPLGDATVFVTHPNGSVLDQPFVTAADGTFPLSQTAGGSYTLRILWSGTEVGAKSVIVTSTGLYLVLADVFYLSVVGLDQAGHPVPGVHLTVTDVTRALIADSRLSDSDGWVVSRLPAGLYRVEANWLGAGVGVVDPVNLQANRTLAMDLSIFSVNLSLVDEAAGPLEGASIEVTLEGFTAGGTTDSQGQVRLQLPGGDVTIRVTWGDVLVFEGTRLVGSGSTDHTLQAQVYLLPVRAVDKDGNPLAGVSLTLLRDEVAVDGGVTGADGTHTFRQPVGTYRLVARLDTTYLLTGIDLTSDLTFTLPADGPVEVRFAEFAPPFQNTTLFPILLGLAGLLAVLGFLLIRWKRGRRARPAEPLGDEGS